jgi:hypothetical protein
MRIVMVIASAISYFVNEAIAKARYGNVDKMNFEAPLTSSCGSRRSCRSSSRSRVSYLLIPLPSSGDDSQWWKLSMIITCGTLAGAIIPELIKVFTSTESAHVARSSPPRARAARRSTSSPASRPATSALLAGHHAHDPHGDRLLRQPDGPRRDHDHRAPSTPRRSSPSASWPSASSAWARSPSRSTPTVRSRTTRSPSTSSRSSRRSRTSRRRSRRTSASTSTSRRPSTPRGERRRGQHLQGDREAGAHRHRRRRRDDDDLLDHHAPHRRAHDPTTSTSSRSSTRRSCSASSPAARSSTGSRARRRRP